MADIAFSSDSQPQAADIGEVQKEIEVIPLEAPVTVPPVSEPAPAEPVTVPEREPVPA